MPPLVEVTFDQKKLDSIARQFKDMPSALPRIVSRGINRTATSSKAEITRELAAEISLKQKRIRAGLNLKKATRNMWQAVIWVNEKRIKLIHFAARALKGKGVSYKIDKRSGRKKIIEPPTSAFIQTMPNSGHVGVFRRATAARGSMYELFGPSLGEVFEGAAGIAEKVQRSSGEKLEKNIDSQIEYTLSRMKR